MNRGTRIRWDAPSRRTGSDGLGPAELAWMTERLCLLGAAAEELGWCLGESEARDFELRSSVPSAVSPSGSPPGECLELGRSRPPTRAAVRDRQRRKRQHERVGHDDWCRAIGVPRTAVYRLAREWDGHGAAAFILEAVETAVEELRVAGPAGATSSEAVSFAIRQRITPMPPVVEGG